MKHRLTLLTTALLLACMPPASAQKVSDLTSISGASVDAAADLLLISDISAGTSKKMTLSQLVNVPALFGSVSATELGYLDGVTSAIQTQLNGKLATGGTAATVTTNANLTGVVTSVGNATSIAADALTIAQTSGLQTALDGINAQLYPYERAGCVGAWDFRNVTTTGTLIDTFVDLSGNGKTLTPNNAGLKAILTGRSAEVQVGGAYNIGGGGILLDYRDHTVIFILAPLAGTLRSPHGVLYQISSGPGANPDFAKTYLYNANRDGAGALRMRPSGNSSYCVVANSTAVITSSNGQTKSNTANTAGTGTLQKICGRSDADGFFGMPAQLVACYIFSRALPEWEVREIEKHHGVQESGEEILLLTSGDSITLGTSATTADVNYFNLAARRLGAAVSYRAISGQNTGAINTATPAADVPIPNGCRPVFIINTGTNDLANATGAEGTLRTNVSALAAKFRLAVPNCKIVLCAILPRTATFIGGQTSGGFDTDRLAHNTWRAGLVGTEVDAYCDWTTDAAFDAAADAANATFFSDQIHPTTAGHALMAKYLEAAVRSVL